jgi:hypothetical protein
VRGADLILQYLRDVSILQKGILFVHILVCVIVEVGC